MKSNIETVANIVVIVIAVAVGSVFLKDRFFSPAPAPQQDSIKAGDKLANVKGWDWAAHDQSLLLVLRKGCHFCEDSMPFYQRLAATATASGLMIVAVFPDSAEEVKEMERSEGLRIPALAGVPLESLKISATPTLLLVDKDGTVEKAWIGMLSPRQELEVMKATTVSTVSGR